MAAAAVMAVRAQKRREAEMQAKAVALFSKFDEDGSGTIDRQELANMFAELGLPVSDTDIDKMLVTFNLPPTGELSLAQFKQVARAVHRKQMASMVDHQGDGALTGMLAFLPTWRHHEYAKGVYNNYWVQMIIASMIVGNFVVNIIEKEIDPYEVEYQQYEGHWRAFDYAFNVIFLIELIVNMYGKWFFRFWKDGWNIFDFVVVLVGVLMMAGALQGAFKNLKILRPLRVFRLFKRVKSLNQIITALMRAIPGVINAFVIILSSWPSMRCLLLNTSLPSAGRDTSTLRSRLAFRHTITTTNP